MAGSLVERRQREILKYLRSPDTEKTQQRANLGVFFCGSGRKTAVGPQTASPAASERKIGLMVIPGQLGQARQREPAARQAPLTDVQGTS